jgi:hypothetical protein
MASHKSSCGGVSHPAGSSGVSCIVKKQNDISGLAIFLQVVALSLFAGSQGIAAQYKAAAPPLRLTTEGLWDSIRAVRRVRG